ncbi:MAG: ATP-binding cassette domain-containing protein, partial [Clostridia bacterium]
SFSVYQGEVLGIGGLAGQGKIGIPNGIMGVYPATGDVEFFGKKHDLGDAGKALRAGMAMVSEDRRGVGLLLDQSIEDNIVFNAMQIKGEYLHKLLFLTNKNDREIRQTALDMIKRLDIRCTSPTQHTGTLSGGNQQKVCIARALVMKPKFLFVSEPTRGIDIGAKKLVLETLVNLNREMGMTIVMVSSELQELRSICDRIAIVSEGRMVDILPTDSSDADFGLAMSGIKPGSQKGGTANG